MKQESVQWLKWMEAHEILKKEMTRVIGKLPQLTPATKGGKPVSVSFVLPFNYKVRV